MGLAPWETSDSQLFVLITGANSGLGYGIAARLIDEFLTSPSTSPKKHLILILCTRAPLKTRFTISRLRAHLRKLVDYSSFAESQRKKAKAQGTEYRWEDMVQRVHFLGVEADLCDLKSVYALADQLVNGTVGSPDATTMDGLKLPHGSPGTQAYSKDVKQDRWALSQEPGSMGAQRAWGWGLSGLRLPRLDVVYLNAGIGGWVGLNWPLAIKEILLDVIGGVTWPTYKLAKVGAVVRSQLPPPPSKSTEEETHPLLHNPEKVNEPPLGEIFCSNVFGHYILAHELTPLLSRPSSKTSQTSGRIIWISTIEAVPERFSSDDIQGLTSKTPYECSKRLTDLLVLTSDLPSVQKISAPYFDTANTVTASKAVADGKKSSEEALVKPRMYVTHPGIFISEIIPLHIILVTIQRFVFFVARWLGSPWHTIDRYRAAVAPTWLALAEPETLEDLDAAHMKWGSSTDRSGEERARRTEVEGWGWDGKVETSVVEHGEKRKGRRKGATDVTQEERENFEILGGECWKEMENLRKEWEVILGVKSEE